MSLINQVLQDLDRRHAGSDTVPNAARSVLPLPESSHMLRWVGMFGATLAGVGLLSVAALTWQNAQGRAVSAAALAPTTNAPRVIHPVLTSTDAIAAVDGSGAAIAMAAPGAAAASAPADAGGMPVSLASAAGAFGGFGSPDAAAAAWSGLATQAESAPGVFGLAPLSTPVSAAEIEAGAASAATLTAMAASAPATGASAVLVASLDPKLPVSVEKRVKPWTGHERAEAEYQRGLRLHELGQTKDAATAFVNALKDDRNHIQARHAAAVELVDLGRLDEAQRLLDVGLELNPHQLQLALTLARVRVDQQDLAGAIDVLKAAISSNTNTSGAEPAQARALLATLQQRNGQHVEAIDNYAAALRQAPGQGAWWIGMGISLAADGRADSAREAFSRARSTGSLSPELQQYVEQRLGSTTH